MRTHLILGACCLMLAMIVPLACTTPNKNIEKQKEQAQASKNLGEAYIREGKYTSALRELLKAEALYPDDYFLQNDLGLVYYYKERQDLAIQHFKKSLALKDDYGPARNNLGNAYAKNNEWDKAIEQWKHVISDLLYATPQFPLSNLGFAYNHKKEYDLAEKYFLEALNVKPDFNKALYGLSQTYIATGRISEAIASLEKATAISPEEVVLHFELAKAYSLNRDYRRAHAAYLKVVQLDPNSTLADQALRESQKIKHLY